MTPDGRRFLFFPRVPTPDPPPLTQIQLVQGWFEELKAKSAAGPR